MSVPVPPWHQAPWAMLQARRARSALPHALLLAGPSGLGKRDFLERLARGLLCEQPVEGDACGHCRACALLEAGTHPDRVHVTFELNSSGKPRKEIVVGQIRALSARLAMASQFGGWQIADVDPADAMNAAAANALLKTLEEPSAASLILLVADAPWRLPATIRSRCQRVDFRLPPDAQALEWLQQAGVEDARGALAAAGGNPGLAWQWHEQGMLSEREQVLADLTALAQGRRDRYAVMQRWTDEALPSRLRFAASAVAEEARRRAAGEPGGLDSRLDADGLGQWFARANRARESLRGPLRVDLVVLELLSHWR